MEAIKRLELPKFIITLVLLCLFLFCIIIIGLIFGPTKIPIGEIFRAFYSSNLSSTTSQIIFEIRIPRILFAVAVGGGLSIAGAVFQAILLNPLAEPYILGISSGGTFGVVLSLLLGLSIIGTQTFAFIGALIVMLLVFYLGKRFGELDPNQLLLTGVMVGAFFSAGILLMMTLLNDSLRTAVFWLIGNLSLADKENLYFVFPVTLLCSFILILLGNQFNILSLGSETAKQLGVNVNSIKTITYLITSLMIGTIVSVSGIVGFVGLLIPHICRLLFGIDNRLIIPASFLIGASYLVIADTIARTVISPMELPVGSITALIGAPVFIFLLRKRFRIIS
jgi:iron complex transport system permease protein